jgi:hypothetical protein
MQDTQIITVEAGTLVRFEDVGISVVVGRNTPEFGAQPFVSILTEDAPTSDIAPSGDPILAVSLNDFDLYDCER